MALHRKLLGHFGFPLFVLAVGLGATGVIAVQVTRNAAAQDGERFEFAVDQLQDSIRDRISTYVAALRAGAGMVGVAPSLDAHGFRVFTDRLQLQQRYPGIQGIGFTARIRASELPGLVATERAAGDTEFHVWPPDPRDEYHAILYLEPLDRRNQAAIGFDMFTEPTRRMAMERARDSGSAAASGRVTLVQEIDVDKQTGFLIYVPVYGGNGVPPTVAERRERLRGFVYAAFRLGDLFAGILGRNRRQRAGFALFDGPSPTGAPLYRTAVDGPVGSLTTTRTIDIAGRNWSATFFSTAALHDSSSAGLVPFVLSGGPAISVLLTGLAWLQTRARQRAEESDRQIQQLLASERAARTEAERVSQLKDEFLATLSHELRTPLNAVVGWAHILSERQLSEEKRRHSIETILRNARVQSRLIEDLLDMSRIISGRTRIEMKTVDMRHVVDAALNAVRPTADVKRIEICIADTPEACQVLGDANRLQQIVWNLLANAIKFTPSGGRIEVELRPVAEQVQLTVADTGIGIEQDFLPYVFERFRQADGSFTRGHGGLGLGLSIVRSLVEMHAGVVRASSGGANTGSAFTVSLPVVAEPSPVAAAGPVRSSLGPLMSLAGLSVLVVDDDLDARELVAEMLAQHGAHVRAAASGAEALRLLRAGSEAPVGLLISDIGMPQMDGYELMRRVRTLPATHGGTVPAIALTAYAGADDERHALAAGFDLHLPKPFTPDELVLACSSLVEDRTA